MKNQNNHEVFEQHRDTSDGERHEDGVLHPDLRAKADATYVNPRSPADDAEKSYQKTRKRVYGQKTPDYNPVGSTEESKIRSDSAWNEINRNFSHGLHTNIGTGKEPDSTSKNIDKDFDELSKGQNKALNERKKYPRTGRTGPG